MRFNVRKFLFVGLEADRAEFFKRAQEAGIVNFVSENKNPATALPEQIEHLAKAIKELRSLPVVEQENGVDVNLASEIAHAILRDKERLNALAEESRIVNSEMSRVEVFGDFSKEDIAYIENTGKRCIQFYCARQGLMDHSELPPEVLYVDSNHGLDYFVALNTRPTQYPKMIEMLLDRPYSELAKRHVDLLQEIELLEKDLKGHAKYNKLLHHALVENLNAYHLDLNKSFVEFPLDADKLFVVQGWVPTHKLYELKNLAQDVAVHVEEVALNDTDVEPTYLENKGAARIGEDLVHIYDTPSSKDKDPSMWVLVSFALFFAMIIGDGGYGLVLLLIALYVRYKNQALVGMKRRALDLCTIIAFSCIVWGVLATSFFGIAIAPDSPLRKVSLMSWLVEKKAAYHIQQHDEVYKEIVHKHPEANGISDPQEFLMKASYVNKRGGVVYNAQDRFADNVLMELALLVGVVHLILSMGRYANRNWAAFGWILFLIGAYLYAPSFLGAVSIVNYVFGVDAQVAAHYGLYLLYVGMSLAVILALIQHKWLGLIEATVVIQIFGDVLSYLRLYALGLAGALLTATMIDLAATLPFILGALLLVMGHAVNIVLGIMGGVIHGLRLNFLEWYHYSFEGGGRMFNPLKKLEIE